MRWLHLYTKEKRNKFLAVNGCRRPTEWPYKEGSAVSWNLNYGGTIKSSCLCKTYPDQLVVSFIFICLEIWSKMLQNKPENSSTTNVVSRDEKAAHSKITDMLSFSQVENALLVPLCYKNITTEMHQSWWENGRSWARCTNLTRLCQLTTLEADSRGKNESKLILLRKWASMSE